MRRGMEEEIVTRIFVQFVQFENFQRSQSRGSNKWRNVYGMYLPSECLFKAIESEKLVKRVGICGIPGGRKYCLKSHGSGRCNFRTLALTFHWFSILSSW